MKVFVACWFFPPSLSSEGIVTYKLLRNSRHSYDVCSSLSKQWSYSDALPLEADNITSLPVDTDDLAEWVDAAVRIFEERHAAHPYDAVMTRSMPPESIEVGRRIKEAHPEIPWIASIADPLAKSPYEIQNLLIDGGCLPEQGVVDFIHDLHFNNQERWADTELWEIAHLREMAKVENTAIDQADGLIFPHDALKRYVLGTRKRAGAVVVHHSFDRTLFPDVSADASAGAADGDGVVTLSFTGHSDSMRSLSPIVRALHEVKRIDARVLDRLKVRFVGHVDEEARTLVYAFDLQDRISIEPSVGYRDTLAIMEESDWVIHVDAKFDYLEQDYGEAGGSVYFAGKIADYMGTDTPILAITGKYSPAYEIVRSAGGVCCDPDDVPGLAEVLFDIASGRMACEADRGYRDGYDAARVAADYDAWLDGLVKGTGNAFNRTEWPVVPDAGTCTQKFLTICVPAYNVENYLDRCLHSLVSCRVADQLEVIVVDDGSPDDSAAIAQAYCDRYPEIVKLVRKENGGHGSTINAALELATGIYFRVLDGDDWMDGEALAHLVGKMRGEGLWPDLVSTDYYQVYADSGKTVDWRKSGPLEYYRVYDFESVDLTSEYFTMASMMFKTELARSLGFKLQEHTFYVDVEFILFAIPYIETVMFTDEHLYRYTYGGAGQSTNMTTFVARFDNHDRVIRRMVEYYAERAATMGESRRAYMRNLFVSRLLATQYALCTIWDPDKARGYGRAAAFDSFLKETDPDLHSGFYKAHPVMVPLMVSGFNTSCPRPARYELPGAGEFVREVAGKIERVPGGWRLMHNPLTRGIARKLSL